MNRWFCPCAVALSLLLTVIRCLVALTNRGFCILVCPIVLYFLLFYSVVFYSAAEPVPGPGPGPGPGSGTSTSTGSGSGSGPYRRYERLPPIQAQFSIESDSDMTESTGLIQEYDVFDPAKPRPPIIFIIGKAPYFHIYSQIQPMEKGPQRRKLSRLSSSSWFPSLQGVQGVGREPRRPSWQDSTAWRECLWGRSSGTSC